VPELPEVEVLRRELARRLVGRRIVTVDAPKLGGFGGLDARAVRRRLEGRDVVSVRRDAKRLVFRFDDGPDLAFHFKLWGLLRWHRRPPASDRLTAVLWTLSGGETLEFRELQLSTFDFVSRAAAAPVVDLLDAPPEALGAPLRGRGAVRAVLSDQRGYPGLGNLYALEILFRASIHPARKANELETRERLAVIGAIPRTLNKAVRLGGYPPFEDLDGKVGRFPLAVYDREGEPCRVCGTAIAAARVGPRFGARAASRPPVPPGIEPIRVDSGRRPRARGTGIRSTPRAFTPSDRHWHSPC
jgi:formamidopyrimidine-DNA glycosylase